LEKRLVVEVDGGQHSSQNTYDKGRDTWIESQSFHVLRFWDNGVLRNIEAVKEVLWQTLRQL
jgi:very-short-patch-repair endonuclease